MPRRRIHLKKKIKIVQEPDRNDKFVFKNSLVFMKRYFENYAVFNKKSLEITCWALGSQAHEIGDYLLKQLPENKQVYFADELSENKDDNYYYAKIVVKMLKTASRKCKINMERFLINLIDQRIEELAYNGLSEIDKKISSVHTLFNLNKQETEFCKFLLITSYYEIPEEFFLDHLECYKFTKKHYLACLLGVSQKNLDILLNGVLAEVGLFEISKYSLTMSDDFEELLESSSPDNLQQKLYTPLQSDVIPLQYHFPYKKQAEHVLKIFAKKPLTSTHILLYGPPGTGKTTFAEGIAKELNIPSFKIVLDEKDSSKNRKAAIIACQNMTNKGEGSLVFVDEADSLLNTRNSWLFFGEKQDKGWLNQLLEKPGLRMIWITNDVNAIEDSVARRFSYSLYFKPFSRGQRIQLWNNILKEKKVKRFFTDNDISQFAKKYNVNAGVINNAINKAIETEIKSKPDFHQCLKNGLESYQTLINNGHQPVNKDVIDSNYSLDGLNLKGDLPLMIEQLDRFDNFLRNSDKDEVHCMNFLFYGPPGTGKSELARYFANRLDREIICKRVSDLQDKYVGESEKNIKQAFAQAEAEEAILIIDEADSLLFNRDRAKRSWEISFTNEFLAQMERYRGILVCSTNRIKDLDSASLRRFQHKVYLDYLTPEGNVIFYEKMLLQLAKGKLNSSGYKSLQEMPNLVPGDFKVVRDKFAFFSPEELDHNKLIENLQKESLLKQECFGKRKIGFLE